MGVSNKYFSEGNVFSVFDGDDGGSVQYWREGNVFPSLENADQSLSGTSGITSAEIFGSTGVVLLDQAISGTSGIASAEAFGADGVVAGPITGDAGITSAQQFGTGGTVALEFSLVGSLGIISDETFGSGGTLILTLTGSAGIPSEEAFGAGGSATGPVTGSSGIPSEEAFGAGGDVGFPIDSIAGIPSAEAFGADGFVLGPITGQAGIPTGEAFGAGGSVAGPINGSAGIPSAEAFGAGGTASITGPITGAAGIPSLEAFGAGGLVTILLSADSGIPSAEAFGAGGEAGYGLPGFIGIPSAEAFGRGGIVQAEGEFALYIGGRNRITQLMANTMSVSLDMTAAGSAQFTLKSMTGVFVPKGGEEVVYIVRGVKKFGGFILKSVVEPFESHKAHKVHVHCADYRKVCDDRTYTRTWTGPTLNLKTIAKDIVASGLSDEGFTYPESSEDSTITGDKLEFATETVTVCFNKLAQYFGVNWWIDPERVIRIERSQWTAAPYVLRDQATPNGMVETWSKLEITRDVTNYRNRQGARTPQAVTGQQTFTVAGDSSTRTWTLSQALKLIPTVLVNGVEKTVVEQAQRGSTPYDFYYVQNSNVIGQNPSSTVLSATDTLKVFFVGQNSSVFQSDNLQSQATWRQRSGGSGIVESVSLARNVRDLASATMFNSARMAQYGPVTEATFISRLEDWRVGQVVHAFTTAPHLAGWFMVKSLQIREIGCTFLETTVTIQAPELPEITALTVTDNGDGTKTIEIDGGSFNYGIDPGGTFTTTGLGELGSSGGVHIMAIAAELVSGNWRLRFTVDDWPGTVQGEGIQTRSIDISATGGEGLSFGQPVLRINGRWTVHAVDRTNKTIDVMTGTDGNPVVDFSGLVYNNPGDGILTGAEAFGSINGTFTAGAGSGGSTVNFTTGQTNQILSVVVSAGSIAGTWVVRLNLDHIPQAVEGDTAIVGRTEQSGTVSLDGSYKIDAVPASPAQYVEFTTGQLCHITDVQVFAGSDDNSWTVRVALDVAPNAVAGDRVNISGTSSRVTLLSGNSDAASKRNYANVHGINGNWEINFVAPGGDYFTFLTNDPTSGNTPLALVGYQFLNPNQGFATFGNGNEALDLTGYNYTNAPDGVCGFNASNGNAPWSGSGVSGGTDGGGGGSLYAGQPPQPYQVPHGAKILTMTESAGLVTLTVDPWPGTLSGDVVTIMSARISATGTTGNPSVAINGDWHVETADEVTSRITFRPASAGNPNVDFTGLIYLNQPDAVLQSPEHSNEGAGSQWHRIVNINCVTGEVTTFDDHGFTSYTSGGTEIAIMGVTSPSRINNGLCRVIVTGPRTFIAYDTSFPFSEPFINDGHGVCKDTHQAIVFASGPAQGLSEIVHGIMAGSTPPPPAPATFLLANTVPGLPTVPLQAGNNQTNPYNVPSDRVIASISATVGTPSDGGPIEIMVNNNGIPVLTSPLRIEAGETTGVATNLARNPSTSKGGDQMTVDVVSVPDGPDQFAGCNAVVNVNFA